MLNERFKAARAVSGGLKNFEAKGSEIIENSVAFIDTMLKAKRTLKLGDTFGLDAMETASAAMHCFIQGMQQVAACHRHLAVHQAEVGLQVVSIGDEEWCKTAHTIAETDHPGLRVVA